MKGVKGVQGAKGEPYRLVIDPDTGSAVRVQNDTMIVLLLLAGAYLVTRRRPEVIVEVSGPITGGLSDPTTWAPI
jgi:hypothetical protein